MNREQLIEEIALVIDQIKLPHPVRVAIDGPGNAGKTTWANELNDELSRLGRRVIRSTIDGFHYSSHIRYQRGKYSPMGYLEDSYNYPLLKKYLLDPLGPEGNLLYKKSIYNFKVDKPTNAKANKADKDSILIFDGIFLFNETLLHYWDYRIYIDASFEITLQRAIKRDSELFGGIDEVIKLYRKRYIPGHEMYLSLCNPIKVSDIALKNDDYVNPSVIKLSNHKSHKSLKEQL
ncbi:MAG: hypothetical protein R3250_05275 [Melioribacteraceae bacterium]|nr:hypothetical protein [Melioribacteraceae bacterium]